jgi:hypothetical protein
MRSQGLEALGEAGAGERLAGRSRIAGTQRVAMAELQPVDAEPVGELVHQRLVGDGGLRHAEAAEGAGRRLVGVDRRAPGAHVGNGVGAHCMDRHAVGDGRSPRGIGAGVEVAGHVAGEQLAIRVGAEARGHPSRMALGARGHAFGPRVDASRTGGPRCQAATAIKRLHRESSLPPKPPPQAVGTMRTRLGLQPQDLRDLVAVHVGRLRRRMDLDPVADALAPSRPRARYRRARRSRSRTLPSADMRPRSVSKALAASPRATRPLSSIVGPGGVQQRRPGRSRRIDADDGRFGDLPAIGTSSSRIANDGRAVADQSHDRLAAIAHLPVGEDRLVLDVGIDAEAVAGHVGGGEHRCQTPAQRFEVAQLKRARA